MNAVAFKLHAVKILCAEKKGVTMQEGIKESNNTMRVKMRTSTFSRRLILRLHGWEEKHLLQPKKQAETMSNR
jgi:hypothetical protein